jgi:hypothetical protein
MISSAGKGPWIIYGVVMICMSASLDEFTI